MNFHFTSLLGVALCGLMAAISGCSSTPETRSEMTQQVRAAQDTLTNFHNDPQMRWFREHMKDARAVLVSPRITRAGFVLGGSGGDALVLARDKGGRWVGPAFYNMGAGSVGFQIGVDVSEVVILVMSERALNALLSSSFKLGGDASIAAGPVGAGAASDVTADMVSFARSKGVYAGLSLEGTVIKPDEGANAAFYGKPASAVDILVRTNVSNPGAGPLQQTLRDMAR